MNRFRLLGCLLRRPLYSDDDNVNVKHPKAYIIGLTGPSGSGKSSVAVKIIKSINKMSANSGQTDRVQMSKVLDCDSLGHKAYRPGTDCYNALLKAFGAENILAERPNGVDSDGAWADGLAEIDRKKLGQLVLRDRQLFCQLNRIVWPAIAQLVFQEIRQFEELNARVLDDRCASSTSAQAARPLVILDGAVLFEAGWHSMCNEVWLTLMTKDECNKRVCNRSGWTPDYSDAMLHRQSRTVARATAKPIITHLASREELQRLLTMPTIVEAEECEPSTKTATDGVADWWMPGQLGCNRQANLDAEHSPEAIGPYSHAHVVFCTSWEEEETQKQVDLSVEQLLQRLNDPSAVNSQLVDQ